MQQPACMRMASKPTFTFTLPLDSCVETFRTITLCPSRFRPQLRNITTLEALVAQQSGAIADLMRRLEAAVTLLTARIDGQDIVIADQGFSRSPTSSPPSTAPPTLADPTRAPAGTAAPTAEPSTTAPTAEPSTAAPTAAPSPAPTAVPTREDIAAGHILISQLHDPAVLCAGGSPTVPTHCSLLSAAQEAAIVQVTGSVRVEHAGADAWPGGSTLAGRFPGLQLVRGDFWVINTYLTALGDGAFGALETVEGNFELYSNHALRAIDGSAFGNLTTVGGYFRLSSNSYLETISGSAFGNLTTVAGNFELYSNSYLEAISGSAFGALVTVAGYFQLYSNTALQAIDGSAFGALETVEGNFQLYYNLALQAINGTVFGALRTVSAGFQVFSNPRLTALSTFGNLTAIQGELRMTGLAPNFNCASALHALECVGSVFYQGRNIQAPPRSIVLPPCA